MTPKQILERAKRKMPHKNLLQRGRLCEKCDHIMICNKATKHRLEKYDIYWQCEFCKFQLRELDKRIE